LNAVIGDRNPFSGLQAVEVTLIARFSGLLC